MKSSLEKKVLFIDPGDIKSERVYWFYRWKTIANLHRAHAFSSVSSEKLGFESQSKTQPK